MSKEKDVAQIEHMHKEMMRHEGKIHPFDHILHAHTKPILIESKR